MLKAFPSIENSFKKFEHYHSVIERYYQPMFFVHEKTSFLEHHCVLVHSNKICLIALALTHPIIKDKKKIKKLNFHVTEKVDRLENKVKGKRKQGGQHLVPNSILCYVDCEDGSKYSIRACIKGKLVEINQLLLSNPNLIVEKPLAQGFIAIILPSLKDIEMSKLKLLTLENCNSQV